MLEHSNKTHSVTSKHTAKISNNMRDILVFLNAGPALLSVKNEKAHLSEPSGVKGFDVSATALAALSERKLIVRDGRLIKLSGDGRAFISAQSDWDDDFTDRLRQTEQMTICEGTQSIKATRMKCECPLDALRLRKAKNGKAFLLEQEWEAGNRLRIDFTQAHMLPSIGMRWNLDEAGQQSGGQGGKADMTDRALAARQRVDHAITFIGPELASPLIDLCCFLKGLEQIEKERGWPARSGKLLIKTGLAALARHYAPPSKTKQHAAWFAQV